MTKKELAARIATTVDVACRSFTDYPEGLYPGYEKERDYFAANLAKRLFDAQNEADVKHKRRHGGK